MFHVVIVWEETPVYLPSWISDQLIEPFACGEKKGYSIDQCTRIEFLVEDDNLVNLFERLSEFAGLFAHVEVSKLELIEEPER